MHEEALRGLGLSKNEINVYISLLELGTSKVNAISNRIILPRTTIYGLLKSLINKGLVSYVIKSGIKYYESADPKRLLSIEKEKILKLEKSLPELEKLKQTIGEKPSIELYEGKEGIKSIYEDILRTKQPVYGYGNTKLLFELLEFYVPNYIKRRIKLGINFHVITERSKTSNDMKKKDNKERRKTRFLQELEKSATITYIYGKKIAIMEILKKQPVGIIIDNKEIYESNKIIFNLMWKISKS